MTADAPAALEGVDDLLVVGVEVREEALVVGVDDLSGGAVCLAELNVAREVGVEGLEDLVVEGNVGLPEGVADLGVVVVAPPDDGGLLFAAVEEPNPGLEATLFLEAGSPLLSLLLIFLFISFSFLSPNLPSSLLHYFLFLFT